VSSIQGYQRTTRYRLQYARTNAQSRKLKGLPAPDEPEPEPPTWQAFHEFDRIVEREELRRLEETEQAKKVLSASEESEIAVYKLAKAHGNQRFLD